MSLRRRLLTIQVVFVALGLGVFAVVTYQLYSRSQYQRVDGQLHSASPGLFRFLNNAISGGAPRSSDDNLPPGSYVELRATNGQVDSQPYQIPCYSGSACPTPKLPASLNSGSDGERYLTVGSTTGSTTFRVLVRPSDPPFSAGASPSEGPPQGALPVAPNDGGFVVTAIPLTELGNSLHRLVVLELVVGALVILALSLAGQFVLGRGLRPLSRLTATAQAIAKGDLGLRASPADHRGEIGQLGLAFDTMMGSIQRAFAAQEASEERLRQFLADASHELRTPLTSIRGYAELYRIGVRGGDLDTAMARIEQNAVEMGALVEELLLLARLDQTAPPLREPVDLTVLAAETVGDAVITAPDRHLTLDAPRPVTVVGDPIHLGRAVTNLLSNAVRHTPAGTPIEVSVGTEGGAAVLEVRDHGPGMGPDGLEHAFDRFWRADRSRAGTGAGLGLAIVAGVAKEHGGHASVSNAPGGGTVFALRLPVPIGSEAVLH